MAMTRDELIELVKDIINVKGKTEEQIDELPLLVLYGIS